MKLIGPCRQDEQKPVATLEGGIDLISSSDEVLAGPGRHDESDRFPHLARHRISLADGHQVGVAVCGRGVPIVLVHGYTAEGMLYAQTLSRIVAAGFKVVAIDSAGHGSTQGLPMGGADFEAYTRLLGRVVDELGIRKAMFAGHSMGGRLVTELAARHPDRALGVILLDAIVGEPWDRIVKISRFNPLLLAGVGGILLADSLSTVPFVHDPRQAVKFGRLARPMVRSHLRNPLRIAGPGISILRSTSSRWMLEKLRKEHVPVVAIHGDRDVVVPLSTARSAAKIAGGMVVVVEGGRHSWLLKDPETLPAILRELFESPLGQESRRRDFERLGLDLDAGLDEIESVFYDPDAAVLALTPEQPDPLPQVRRRAPRYSWRIELPA
ncbi:MAG: alpha/beta hydrolase [Acidimicrobiales bacterium]|nr:alpha/beta hydrolase [Acidimicrobiales bacterium]